MPKKLNEQLQRLQDRVQAAEANGTIKVNITRPGDSNEGIWACLATPEDRVIYDRDKAGETCVVFLMNNALITGPTWGARLKVKMSGNNQRPTIAVDELCEQMTEAVKSGDYPNAEAFR